MPNTADLTFQLWSFSGNFFLSLETSLSAFVDCKLLKSANYLEKNKYEMGFKMSTPNQLRILLIPQIKLLAFEGLIGSFLWNYKLVNICTYNHLILSGLGIKDH